MKKKIILITILVILIGAMIFSILAYDVINPVSCFGGMFEVIFTNKNYTVVQNFPKKVMLSKSTNIYGKTAKQLLDEYMQSRNFVEIEEERLGGILVYTNGEIKEKIGFSVNGYFSKWEWE